MTLLILFVVFVPMLVEARRSARNERAARARGGVEPAGDVYNAMRIAYPAAFLAMIAEGALRGDSFGAMAIVGVLLFAAGKALKWWAILTLGPFWSFRVIVIPGTRLVASGPYRYLRHPNYAGLVGELVGTALMAGAIVAGPVATAGFMLLIARRMAIENAALSGRARDI